MRLADTQIIARRPIAKPRVPGRAGFTRMAKRPIVEADGGSHAVIAFYEEDAGDLQGGKSGDTDIQCRLST